MNRLVACFVVWVCASTATAQSKYVYDSSWQSYTPSLQFRYIRKKAFSGSNEYYQYGFQNPSNTPVSFEFRFSYIDTFGTKQERSGRMTIKGNSKPNQVSNGWSFEGPAGQSIMPTITIYEDGFDSASVNSSTRLRGSSSGTSTGAPRPHQKYPNVDVDSNGKLQPRAGYRWQYPDASDNYAVVWNPGKRHPRYPGIYAGKNVDGWSLLAGYRWKYPGTNKLDTVKIVTKPTVKFVDLKVVGNEFKVSFKHEGIRFQPCKMTFYFREKGSTRLLATKYKWFTPKYDPGDYVNDPVSVVFDRSRLRASNIEWWVDIHRHPNWGKGTKIATSWGSTMLNSDAYRPSPSGGPNTEDIRLRLLRRERR